MNITPDVVVGILIVSIISLYIIWTTYKTIYFKSETFLSIKSLISDHVADCNMLNQYIEQLYANLPKLQRIDHGTSNISDNSKYKFKRKKLSEFAYSSNTVNCSNAVLRNARNSPLKYLLKYFNIPPSVETLENIDSSISIISSVISGKAIALENRNKIIGLIKNDIPIIIKTLAFAELSEKLGFSEVHIPSQIYDEYIFKYISAGGNSSSSVEIALDLDNLERLSSYISDLINKQSTAKYQRQLMTRQLREAIKERDSHTCCFCGNSTMIEPNLLLEIDHIIPVSKGGKTSIDNLQTLCWRCNRTKSNKLSQVT